MVVTKGEIRQAVFSVADWAAARTPIGRPVQARYGGLGCAFMLHSLVPDPRDHLFHEIRFSVTGLRAILSLCRRRGIDLVTLDEAMRRLGAGGPGPFAVMTFDDGYRDNLSRALPLFEEAGAPMTVFVTTDVIERNLFYWWGGLVALLRQEEVVEVEALGRRLPAHSQREKAEALRVLSRWVGEEVAVRARLLRPVFRRYGIDPVALLDAGAMTRDELRRLARSPLVTVGSHTTTHRPLASLTVEEARADVADNRAYLRDQTGQDVRHFAYPHGDEAACGPRDAAVVRDLGFATASSTHVGGLFAEHAARPFMLPRSILHPRREAGWHVLSQLMGTHRLLASRAGAPIDPRTLPPVSPEPG